MNKITAILVALIATAAATQRYTPERSWRVYNRYEESSIRLQERHQRYGLQSSRHSSALGSAGEYDPEQSDASNLILGWAMGLSFSDNDFGDCYYTFFDIIDLGAQFWNVFSEIYMPWNWAQMGFVVQDYFEVSAAQQAMCDFQKVLTTVTGLTTSDGQSELGARIMGGFIDVIPNSVEKIANADNTYEMGTAIGAITQIVLDWTIS